MLGTAVVYKQGLCVYVGYVLRQLMPGRVYELYCFNPQYKQRTLREAVIDVLRFYRGSSPLYWMAGSSKT